MSPPEQFFESSKPTNILVGEARITASRVQGIKIKNAIHADKLLLALLEFAVGDEGRRHTASAILAAGNDKDVILETAQACLDDLLFPFKAAAIERMAGLSGEETPADDEDCSAITYRKPIDKNEEALRALVARREGQRCAITGAMSPDAKVVIPSVRATHILPHTLHAFNHDRAQDNDKQKMSARSWEVIKNWGSLDVQNLVVGPTNTINLRMDLSLTFRHFLWWLKPTEEENTYIIKSHLTPFSFSNRRITFTDQSTSNIPLPDPRILRLHAALANVLHISGAAEYFDRVWSTAEKSGVLSEDGSSDLGALLSALAL